MKPENTVRGRHSIATKLLRVVFALYIIIAAVVTISHMVMEYRYQKNNISHDLEDIQRTFEHAMAVDMWKMDQESLHLTLKGMLKIPVIVGVKISDDSGNSITTGGIIEQDGEVGRLDLHIHMMSRKHTHSMHRRGDESDYELFEHRFPIVYTFDDDKKQLGEATIYSNKSVILRRVKLGFLLLVVTTVFKITILWFIFQWIFKSILKRPLSILTAATERVDLDHLEKARVDIKRDGNDELTLLAGSFNDMVTNLQASLDERKRAEEALRESEEQVRMLLNSTAESIYGLDLNGNCTFCNRACLELLGYNSAEDIPGKNMHEVIHHTHTNGSACSIEKCQIYKAFQVGKGVHIDGEVLWRADGTSFPAEFWSYPTRRDGEITGSVVTFMDITERKQAEAEIIEKNKQLRSFNEQLMSSEQQLKASNQQLITNEKEREKLLKDISAKNEELKSIVYIASHDLKSPLVNITGFSDMLNKTCREITERLKDIDVRDEAMHRIVPLIDEEIPESLGFISAGTSKMKMLLDGLLQVSRVGSQEVDIDSLDMNKMVHDIADTFAFQIKEQDVSVTIEELPGCKGDEKLVNQVFSNIIGNAIKYFDPERKGSINITGRCDNSECIYCVEDNGIGIHKNHQGKVFELFHRLNPDDATDSQGLGLTITKRALDRNSGWTWVESEPGKGSKFFVSLPVAV
ncbi:MAG: PAS domain S-box protein [Planctomycetes bacterium]|nr:PAS domain S-box protein [Planctomycetota bacterium]